MKFYPGGLFLTFEIHQNNFRHLIEYSENTLTIFLGFFLSYVEGSPRANANDRDRENIYS